ncbi:MAG: hypothetical protein LBP19_01645 [Treponema sp.]|jgi:hypothetical protein|nr:hypothetical protein [Treponema sp.]
MSTHDYIPRKDADFDNWANQLIGYSAAHADAWGIPAAEITGLQSQYATWHSLYEAAVKPTHNAVDTLRKNENREVFEKNLRDFVNQRLRYNPAVTDADKEAMGLVIPKPSHTPVPPPHTQPELTVELRPPLVAVVHFRDKGSAHRGKPDHVHGIEIRWGIQDTPPLDGEQLPHSAFDTSDPKEFTFSGVDRGKTVYFCGRWENNKGDEGKGHWGEIVSAIIP